MGKRSKMPILVALLLTGAVGFSLGRASVSLPSSLKYKGYSVSNVRGLSRDQVEALKHQIDMVVALPIKPDAAAFFRAQPIRLSMSLEEAGASGVGGVVLRPAEIRNQGPVLLHELLHIYHRRVLPDGIDNAMVENAFESAWDRDLWPPDSYMMSNKSEFFAMTASAVLNGVVRRPPGTRQNVAERMPTYYRWLVDQFGLAIR